MKVTLVSPVNIPKNYLVAPSAALAVLSSILKDNDISCECIDCNFLPSIHNFRFTSGEEIERKLLEECVSYVISSKPDVVGISSWGSSLPFSIFLSNSLRQHLPPSVPIILGGILSSLLAKKILQVGKNIDAVVLGEGDQVFLKILDRLLVKKNLRGIPGVAYRENGKIWVEPPGEPLSVNSWGKTDYSSFINPLNKPNYYYYYIEGSRGCTHNCVFCCLNQQPLRRRTPSDLVEEVFNLIETEGATQINFTDNMFPLDGSWINNFCDLLNRKGLEVAWRCCARIDKLSFTTIRKMARAGCRSICVGLESTSPNTLKFIHKSSSILKYLSNLDNNIEVILDNGIDLQVSTIIGFPYEGVGEIQRTSEFSLKLQEMGVKAALGPVVVYPGSRLWDMYLEGKIELSRIMNPKIRRHEEGLFSSYFSDDPYIAPFGFLPKHKFIEQEDLESLIYHYMWLTNRSSRRRF